MGLKKKSKISAEFSMSSLTDIIFLLLIFFMLTSSMVVPNALNLKMPGKSKSSNQPKYPPTEVVIAQNGTYTLNGRSAKRSDIEQTVRTLKKERSKLSLIITPNDNVANEYVVAILDIAYRYHVDAIMTDPK
jgi:biopolymer transport protein ExbD